MIMYRWTQTDTEMVSCSIITDKHLHVLRPDGTARDDVWAIGDAAVIKDGTLPATAQGLFIFSSEQIVSANTGFFVSCLPKGQICN